MIKPLIRLRKKFLLPIKRFFWIREYSEGFRMRNPSKVFLVHQALEQERIMAETSGDDQARLIVAKALNTFHEVIDYDSSK